MDFKLRHYPRLTTFAKFAAHVRYARQVEPALGALGVQLDGQVLFEKAPGATAPAKAGGGKPLASPPVGVAARVARRGLSVWAS
jgi:hypothetical protein